MAGEKLSARQKMINMMYLVLTALLALNVSKEVLNAFKVVGTGINNSNISIQDKNEGIYTAFDKVIQADKSENTLVLYNLAQRTKQLTSESIQYIEDIRSKIQEESKMVVNENGEEDYQKSDDIDTGTRILTKAEGGKDSKGEEFRKYLVQLHNDYLDVVDEGNPTAEGTDGYRDYRAEFASIISVQAPPEKVTGSDGKERTWDVYNFFNVPVVATDVILSKIKNDVLNTETEVLEYLSSQVGADIVDFDQLTAEVIAPKSYLPAGKEYQSEIFIAASSSKQETEVYVGKLDLDFFDKDSAGALKMTFVEDGTLPFDGDYEQLETEGGRGIYSKMASGVGLRKYEGVIRVKKPTGGYDIYPFFADYEVAPPSGFSVSATKMNVLYIGVDNPMSITVSGSKDSDVSASMSQGSISRSGSGWVARVSTVGNVNISVSGVIDGERKSIGTAPFRVKRIPDPVPTLGGDLTLAQSGKSQVGTIKAKGGIVPILKDFDFDARFTVVSYDFFLSSGGELIPARGVSGPLYNTQVTNLLNRAKPNDMIFFDNIKVKGPDGTTRKIPSMTYTVF